MCSKLSWTRFKKYKYIEVKVLPWEQGGGGDRRGRGARPRVLVRLARPRLSVTSRWDAAL